VQEARLHSKSLCWVTSGAKPTALRLLERSVKALSCVRRRAVFGSLTHTTNAKRGPETAGHGRKASTPSVVPTTISPSPAAGVTK
jgi:hypothetical protein